MIERKTKLLIIPSPLILPRTYRKLSESLAEYFEVQIIKLPATGLRSSKSYLWDETRYAEEIVQKIEPQDDKFLILGHSNSGPIAAKVSLLAPEMVAGVILSDTTGIKKISYLRTLFGRTIDGFLELKFSILAAPHLLLNILFHPKNFFYQVQLSIKNVILEEFQNVPVRTLILWGRRDHTMPMTEVEKLKKIIPQSDLYVSETGSHDWILTNPLEASEIIKAWAQINPWYNLVNEIL